MGDSSKYSQYMVCFRFSPGQQSKAGLNQMQCTCHDPCKGCNKQRPVQDQGSSEYGTSDDDDKDSSASSEDTTLSEVLDHDDDTDSGKSHEVQSDARDVLDENPPVRDDGEILQRITPSMVTDNISRPRRRNVNPYTLLPVALDNPQPQRRGAQL